MFDNLGSDVAESCCTTSGNFVVDKAVQDYRYILLGVGRMLILLSERTRIGLSTARARGRKDGWYLDRVNSSHNIFKHPTKKGRVVVPHPKPDLPIGTYKGILKQAGL